MKSFFVFLPLSIVIFHLGISSTAAAPASGTSSAAEIDPAFASNLEVWLAPRTDGADGDGSQSDPFNASTQARFDRIMCSFYRVHNVTFHLAPGTYLTKGCYEGATTTSSEYWQVHSGWRILGSGIDSTIIKLVGAKIRWTKYVTIGNTGTPQAPSCIKNVELAYLTVDADGGRHSESTDSNFGCVFIYGSNTHVHDIKCINAKNALSPQANNTKFAELFILGVDSYLETTENITQNVIERCHIINASFNRTNLTTGISIGSGGRTSNAYGSIVRDCLVDGIEVSNRFHGITMHGTADGVVERNQIINTLLAFYNDGGPQTDQLIIRDNSMINVSHGVYFNYDNEDRQLHRLAVINNHIELGLDTRAPANIGINIVGKTTANTVQAAVIRDNVITMLGGRLTGTNIVDHGVQVIRIRSVLVERNTIKMDLDANAIRAKQFVVNPYIYENRSPAGRLLKAKNTLTSSEYFRENKPSTDLVTRGIFAFANDDGTTPPPPPPGGTFAKVFEAEDGILTAPFALYNSPAASKGVYVTTPNAKGAVTFPITVPSNGRYYLWTRVIAPDPGTDSFFVSIDGDEDIFDAVDHNWESSWQWSRLNGRNGTVNMLELDPRVLTLSAGEHTIIFRGRDAFTLLDRLVITDDPAFVATDRSVDALANPPPPPPAGPEQILVEAESGDIDEPMLIQSDAAASGRKKIVTGENFEGTATYSIQIERGGEYALWCRILAPSTESDSFFVAIDGEEDVFDMAERRASPFYQWTRLNGRGGGSPLAIDPRRLQLAPGRHEIVFRGREKGAAIDRFLITSNLGLVPTDTTPASLAGLAPLGTGGQGSPAPLQLPVPYSSTADSLAISVELPVGYSAIANPLSRGGNTLKELLPTPLPGTLLYKFDSKSQEWLSNGAGDGGWADPSATLAPGEGALLFHPGPQPLVVTWTGRLSTDVPLLSVLPGAYELVGLPSPTSGTVSELFAFEFLPGDTIGHIDGGLEIYKMHTYTATGWDIEPRIALGQSFFINLVPRSTQVSAD